MRLAFFSPLSPQRSGISDYSEDLLPTLVKGADIDLFTEQEISPTNPAIIENFSVFPYSQFEQNHQQTPYDLCLYQMGNNPKYHRYMDALIQAHPGIVTLHDFVLQHFYVEMFRKEKREDDYQRAMETYYGEMGRKIAESFRLGILHDYVFYQFPLYQRVVEPSLGTIVHNTYVKTKMLQYNSAYRIEMINMGITLPDLEQYRSEELRKKYHISRDRFVIGAYGYISPGKRIPELLRAFSEFVKDVPQALCLLVGHLVDPKELPGFDMRRLIHELQIDDQVIITGFTPYDQFFEYIALSDVCVNLRHPTVRATSANILKIMAFAKPIIVSDLCELLDLSTAYCIKVPLNDTEEEKLLQAFRTLYQNPGQRKTLGRNARTYIEEYHSVQQAAEQYLAFCSKLIAEKKAEKRPSPP